MPSLFSSTYDLRSVLWTNSVVVEIVSLNLFSASTLLAWHCYFCASTVVSCSAVTFSWQFSRDLSPLKHNSKWQSINTADHIPFSLQGLAIGQYLTVVVFFMFSCILSSLECLKLKAMEIFTSIVIQHCVNVLWEVILNPGLASWSRSDPSVWPTGHFV